VINIHLDTPTARDISQRVDRLLRDVGYVEGTVELPLVRDFLNLDLQYYTSDDPALATEVIHRLRVGAKQLLRRPGLLVEAIKSFDLKALFLPDRKRILVDTALPDLKKRWSETHEISHSLLPWHRDYLLGDTVTTLSVNCHQLIEAEANFGAGRLLFPATAFESRAYATLPSIPHVRHLATYFGNTITSTLWRFVEKSPEICFALIGEHPHHPRPNEPAVAHFVRSKPFEEQFADVTEAQSFQAIKTYCSYKRTGPLGNSEIRLRDRGGMDHHFFVETFSVKHSVLTLGYHARKTRVLIGSVA
jgi:Zn-dependent peptidase ImmA (M78 family)